MALAWAWWAGLLVVLGLLVWALFAARADGARPVRDGVAYGFFGLSLAWLVIGVPGAMVLRGHCLWAAWQGRGVDPASYLRGMKTIWLSIAVVWVLSWVGCLVGGRLQPGVLPLVIGLLVYLSMLPQRQAMRPWCGVDGDRDH